MADNASLPAFRLRYGAGTKPLESQSALPSYIAETLSLQMTWQGLPFWTGAAFIPAFFYAINLLVRWQKRLPQTTGADWCLLLAALNLSALNSPSEFSIEVTYPPAHDHPTQFFIIFLCLGLMLWVLAVMFIEPALERARRELGGNARFSRSTVTQNCLSLGLTLLYTFLNVSIFLYKA